MKAPDGFESWLFGKNIYKPNTDQQGKYYVASLSGGKDSTAQLLKMLENNIFIDEVIYVDVEKEMPEMENHIDRLKELTAKYNIKFTHLTPEHNFNYWLGEHVKTRGKNKGKVGYGWPDHMNRWCTSQLKQQTISRYLKELRKQYDTVEFIGYAADELERTKKNADDRIKEFPLVLWDIEEQDALDYCYQEGFNWNGLYEKCDRVSCYLCPLSRLGELKYIFENYPWLWLEMRMLDDKSYRDFRSDYTLAELEHKFLQEFYQDLFGYKQMELFKNVS